MSQQVVITDTAIAYPSGFDSTNSVYDSVNSSYPIENGYASATNTNYAQINITTGANAETWIYYTFAPSIPNGSTITSISCQAKASINSTTARIAIRQIQMYTGTTDKGTAQTLTSAATTFTFTESVNDWTVSQLNNARIVMHVQRSTKDPSRNYYVDFYGATLTIGYTFEGIAYEITSSSNIPNTKGVSINPEYQLQPESASVTITNVDGLNLRLIDTYGANKTTQTFNNTSYTYTLNNLNNDHNIVVDYNTTNYFKINDQWHSIAGVYQKSSGTWSTTTFNSAFPSGTMIKQGNDIGDEVPLVKFLSNCDVIYFDGYGDDESSSRVYRTFRKSDPISLDGKICYILTIYKGNLGLHKVSFHFPSSSSATSTSTSIFEYGNEGTKILLNNDGSERTRIDLSTTGSAAIAVYSGTMITLKLKDNIPQSATELESLFTGNGGIRGSAGYSGYGMYDYVSVGDSIPYPAYLLTVVNDTFGLSYVDGNYNVTPILGYTSSYPETNIINRSAIFTYNNYYTYYSGLKSNSQIRVYGGYSFIYM